MASTPAWCQPLLPVKVGHGRVASFEIMKCAKGTAAKLLGDCFNRPAKPSRDPRVSYPNCCNFNGCVVLYGLKQDKPVGWAVSFWPGKDPFTCYQSAVAVAEAREANAVPERATGNAPVSVAPQQYPPDPWRRNGTTTPAAPPAPIAKRQAPAPVSYWGDVGVRCLASYNSRGLADEFFATWTVNGEKEFFRVSSPNKVQGKSSRFCFIFDHDRLNTIVQVDGGQPRAIYLMSGWRIEKAFDDIDDAKADPNAGPRLARYDEIVSNLRAGNADFLKTHKAEWQKIVAQHTSNARIQISENMAMHQREREAMGRDVMNAVKQAPASRTVIYSPDFNYVPYVIE